MSDLFDDPFHACALRAWMEVAREIGSWPPDSEQTRRLAYRLYERELRTRNERRDRIERRTERARYDYG